MSARPAVGNFSGGLLAESAGISDRTLSLALHVAARVVLGVVGIELMPEALTAEPAWLVLLAFVAGGGFATLRDDLTAVIADRIGGGATEAGP